MLSLNVCALTLYRPHIPTYLHLLAAVEGAPEEGDLPLGDAAVDAEDAASAELVGIDAEAGGLIVDGTIVAGAESTSGLAAVLAEAFAENVVPVVRPRRR